MENKISKSEYLKIKKQALLDRKKCESEIEKDPENIEVMLDAFSTDYEGEARLLYRVSFLMPNDAEFRKIYYSHKKNANACSSYFKGSEFSDIITKVTAIEKYGICDDVLDMEDEIEMEMLELVEDEESVTLEESPKGFEADKTRQFFSPLEHFDFDEQEMADISLEERIESEKKPSTVEKQTEDALQKINSLFTNTETKDEIIRDQEAKIAELESERETLVSENESLLHEKNLLIQENETLEAKNKKLEEEKKKSDEQACELSAQVIGLEEENKALKAAYQTLIKAINEKYGEYEETYGKRK